MHPEEYQSTQPNEGPTQTESLDELLKALNKAQSSMEGARKDSANPFFKSNYADLSSCWEAIRKPFGDNGLSIVQMPQESKGGLVRLKTIVGHSSGQWMGSTCSARPVKDDPQAYGSCLTYLRRYSLCAFAGVSPEDDDGNLATAPKAYKHKSRGVVNAPTSKGGECAFTFGKHNGKMIKEFKVEELKGYFKWAHDNDKMSGPIEAIYKEAVSYNSEYHVG